MKQKHDVVVVLRDKAQEWDFKHSFAPLVGEKRLQEEFDSVWFAKCYGSDDDYLRGRFGEDYSLLRNGLSEGCQPGDILMRVPAQKGKSQYVKANAEDGFQMCMGAFDAEFRNLCGVVAQIFSLSGATSIEMHYETKKSNKEVVSDKRMESTEVDVGVEVKAPINGVSSKLKVENDFKSNESDAGKNESETREGMKAYLLDVFVNNKKLAGDDEKIAQLIAENGLEDNNVIKELLHKLKHRSDVIVAGQAEIEKNTSWLVRAIKWIKGFFGIESEGRKSRGQKVSKDNRIVQEITYEGYERCKECIKSVRKLENNLSISGGYGVISGGVKVGVEKNAENDRQLDRVTEEFKSMKIEAMFSE